MLFLVKVASILHASLLKLGNSTVHYGQFLAQLRAERGLTQSGLAESAAISLEAVKAAEKAAHRRMYPRTFLALMTALHRLKPLSGEQIAHFGVWSGISMEVLLAAIEHSVPASKRVASYAELPPLTPLLTNAIAACLLKLSQTQLSDILYEVSQTLTRAQLDTPLPKGEAKPTRVTGPGLLGLQHPEDNGYRVRIFFEPRASIAAAAQADPWPVVTPEVKRRKAR